jgi:pilus assembly protein CpaF
MGLTDRLINKVKLDEKQKKQILKEVTQSIKNTNNLIDRSVLSKKDLEEKIYLLLKQITKDKFPNYNFSISDELVERAISKIYGLGILENYLTDKAITDIFINNNEMIIIKNGKKIYLGQVFEEEELSLLIDKIKKYSNKTIDQRNPFLNTDLFDGSRCSIVIPPISDKIYISIRVFNCIDYNLKDLLRSGMFNEKIYSYLIEAIKNRRNILIAGAMGSGKTTLLNTLAKLIPRYDFINVIQDVPEIRLKSHPYVRLLLTRPGTREIDNEVNYDKLVYETLRMKADRIIIGEIRNSVAAYQVLQTLNTGHRGSFCTIHSDSALDALLRLETLAMEYKNNINSEIIKRLIVRSIDNVIFLKAQRDRKFNIKSRKIEEIVSLNKKLDKRGEYKLTYH